MRSGPSREFPEPTSHPRSRFRTFPSRPPQDASRPPALRALRSDCLPRAAGSCCPDRFTLCGRERLALAILLTPRSLAAARQWLRWWPLLGSGAPAASLRLPCAVPGPGAWAVCVLDRGHSGSPALAPSFLTLLDPLNCLPPSAQASHLHGTRQGPLLSLACCHPPLFQRVFLFVFEGSI